MKNLLASSNLEKIERIQSVFDFSILFGEPIERLSDGFHDIMLPCPCGTCVSIMFFQQVIRLEEVLYEDFEIK